MKRKILTNEEQFLHDAYGYPLVKILRMRKRKVMIPPLFDEEDWRSFAKYQTKKEIKEQYAQR